MEQQSQSSDIQSAQHLSDSEPHELRRATATQLDLLRQIARIRTTDNDSLSEVRQSRILKVLSSSHLAQTWTFEWGWNESHTVQTSRTSTIQATATYMSLDVRQLHSCAE